MTVNEEENHGNEQDALMLCPSCLQENHPDAAFCLNCRSPLGDTVNLDPLRRIPAYGFLYRKASTGSPSKIGLIGMWLIFGPCLLVPPFMLVDDFAWPELISVALYVGFAAFLLYRTTKNYLRQANEQSDEEPSPD